MLEKIRHPYLRPGTNDAYIWRMVFEHNLYGLTNLAGATVIDIGAHIGAFSVKAGMLGASSVLSVEPNPENFTSLERNTAHLQQVARRLEALDYEGLPFVPISGHEKYNTGRVYSGHDAMSGARYLVPSVKLSALMEFVPSGRIGVLKLDCQGAEWQLFFTEPPTTWHRIDEIVGEIHADLHFNRLLTFIQQERMFAGDGLDPKSFTLRDWAIQGVRAFARRHQFEVEFSLDEEDENSAEFHAYRSSVPARCQIEADD